MSIRLQNQNYTTSRVGKLMAHFLNLEKNLIYFLWYIIFYHTWYDVPNLNILPFMAFVILTPLAFFYLWYYFVQLGLFNSYSKQNFVLQKP